MLWLLVIGPARAAAAAAAVEPAAADAAAPAAAPAPVELSRAGKALVPVVVGPRASDETKKVAAELAGYLGRISGGTFAVETRGDAGAGPAAVVVLGRPGDFDKLPFDVTFGPGPFEREDYLLRSRAAGNGGGLYLLGASDLAVSHAAWDVLHRLGHRQFFPGETWEVVPHAPDLSLPAVDERVSPSFHARRIWYDYALNTYNQDAYAAWCRRNRMAQGFALNSGHAYLAIIDANRQEFDRHPEYFALLDGKRELRPDVKFCIANAGLRKLVIDHAVRFFTANPAADSLSVDPSDGFGWCECDGCARMGTPGTRVAVLANEVAEAANKLNLGQKYVGFYAYNMHAAPPAVRVHPNVIPSATTALIGGGFTFDQVVEGWQKQGATMGVYDYLSVVDWDWNLPRGASGGRPADIAKFIPAIHAKGVRFYDAQSGDAWGPYGLGHYVAGRLLWDVREAARLDATVDDFLDKSFGTAKEPMREFYRLINFETTRRPPSDLLGRMYRQLDAARKATTDPAVLKRVDDLTLYTRHAELYHAFANGGGKVEDVVRHAYRMRKTGMVHTYGLWAKLIGQDAAEAAGHPLKSDDPFGPEELAKILADGVAKNLPVDPGFEGVEFSRDLVPAAAPLKLPDGTPGNFPTHPQNAQRYHVWLPEGAARLDMKITVEKVWALRAPAVSLYSSKAVTSDPVATDANYKPDGTTKSVALATPHAGLHRVETVDGGDYTRIEWPAGVPVTVESGIDTPGITSHFNGGWTLYFYVPKGTKRVGGWASRIANWAPRAAGKLLDADGREAFDFAKAEEGWFNVHVPDGQDGRVWKFQDSQGQRLLMTVPPYLARSPADLLLPAEVVAADRKP